MFNRIVSYYLDPRVEYVQKAAKFLTNMALSEDADIKDTNDFIGRLMQQHYYLQALSNMTMVPNPITHWWIKMTIWSAIPKHILIDFKRDTINRTKHKDLWAAFIDTESSELFEMELERANMNEAALFNKAAPKMQDGGDDTAMYTGGGKPFGGKGKGNFHQPTNDGGSEETTKSKPYV